MYKNVVCLFYHDSNLVGISEQSFYLFIIINSLYHNNIIIIYLPNKRKLSKALTPERKSLENFGEYVSLVMPKYIQAAIVSQYYVPIASSFFFFLRNFIIFLYCRLLPMVSLNCW